MEYNNGGQGEGWTKTPNMNRAAMRGVKLDSYCDPPPSTPPQDELADCRRLCADVNPICSPTRATIQTGRYTIRTGIQHACYSSNTGVGLPLTERTIGNALQVRSFSLQIYA